LILLYGDVAGPVPHHWRQLAWFSISVVRYERICHLHDAGGASTALNDLMLSRGAMGCWEFTNSSWMRKLKAVQ
jgi:hypothetical protein